MSGTQERAQQFTKLLEAELDEIENSRAGPRQYARPFPKAGKPEERASRAQLLGLAFSGGGIRSATFNLGVLQGLAKLGLLRRFDYLSTVSGGGYLGTWLMSCVQ